MDGIAETPIQAKPKITSYIIGQYVKSKIQRSLIVPLKKYFLVQLHQHESE